MLFLVQEFCLHYSRSLPALLVYYLVILILVNLILPVFLSSEELSLALKGALLGLVVFLMAGALLLSLRLVAVQEYLLEYLLYVAILLPVMVLLRIWSTTQVPVSTI